MIMKPMKVEPTEEVTVEVPEEIEKIKEGTEMDPQEEGEEIQMNPIMMSLEGIEMEPEVVEAVPEGAPEEVLEEVPEEVPEEAEMDLERVEMVPEIEMVPEVELVPEEGIIIMMIQI